ncbi:hypothetical protein VIAG107301_19475 [Vibrio agarivorans]
MPFAFLAGFVVGAGFYYMSKEDWYGPYRRD